MGSLWACLVASRALPSVVESSQTAAATAAVGTTAFVQQEAQQRLAGLLLKESHSQKEGQRGGKAGGYLRGLLSVGSPTTAGGGSASATSALLMANATGGVSLAPSTSVSSGSTQSAAAAASNNGNSSGASSGAAAATAITRMLQDSQERLIFRCSVHLRYDITAAASGTGHSLVGASSATSSALALAPPAASASASAPFAASRSAAASSLPPPPEAVLLLRLRIGEAIEGTGLAAAVAAASPPSSPMRVRGGEDEEDDLSSQQPSASVVVLQDLPAAMVKGIAFFNLLYPVVDEAVFGLFAEECMRLLRAAAAASGSEMARLSTPMVQSAIAGALRSAPSPSPPPAPAPTDAASTGVPTSSEVDQHQATEARVRLAVAADLRQCPLALHALFSRLRALLQLRELIGRYPAPFSAPVTEKRFDVKALLLQRRFAVASHVVDVRKDIEEDMRIVCESIIDTAARECCDALRRGAEAASRGLVLPPAPQLNSPPAPAPAQAADTQQQPSEERQQQSPAPAAADASAAGSLSASGGGGNSSAGEAACRRQLAAIAEVLGRYISNAATRAVLLAPIREAVEERSGGAVRASSLE